jgi:uncharacterized membrane protein YcjF (UPF0283 family)
VRTSLFGVVCCLVAVGVALPSLAEDRPRRTPEQMTPKELPDPIHEVAKKNEKFALTERFFGLSVAGLCVILAGLAGVYHEVRWVRRLDQRMSWGARCTVAILLIGSCGIAAAGVWLLLKGLGQA